MEPAETNRPSVRLNQIDKVQLQSPSETAPTQKILAASSLCRTLTMNGSTVNGETRGNKVLGKFAKLSYLSATDGIL
jgi:hypothetical protein